MRAKQSPQDGRCGLSRYLYQLACKETIFAGRRGKVGCYGKASFAFDATERMLVLVGGIFRMFKPLRFNALLKAVPGLAHLQHTSNSKTHQHICKYWSKAIDFWGNSLLIKGHSSSASALARIIAETPTFTSGVNHVS